jgi:hypothetical protein
MLLIAGKMHKYKNNKDGAKQNLKAWRKKE